MRRRPLSTLARLSSCHSTACITPLQSPSSARTCSSCLLGCAFHSVAPYWPPARGTHVLWCGNQRRAGTRCRHVLLRGAEGAVACMVRFVVQAGGITRRALGSVSIQHAVPIPSQSPLYSKILTAIVHGDEGAGVSCAGGDAPDLRPMHVHSSGPQGVPL